MPLVYYKFTRIIVDEIHESLCTSKGELKEAQQATQDASTGFFTEKNRRAWHLSERRHSTSTCLPRSNIRTNWYLALDSSNRVVELANVTGGNYVTGLETHWRKMERESRRDEFLHHKLELMQSREIRKQIYSCSQSFLDVVSCRNKVGDEMKGVELKRGCAKGRHVRRRERGLLQEPKWYCSRQKEPLNQTGGFRCISRARHKSIPSSELSSGLQRTRVGQHLQINLETDPTTKTVVFTDGTIGAGLAARDFLDADGIGCTWIDDQANSVQVSCRSRSLAGFPLTMLQLHRERTRRSLGIRMAMQLKKTGFVLVFSF